MINNIYGNMDILMAGLDGTSKRYENISNNLANVNTPGFKKSTVDFESQLSDVIANRNTKLPLCKTNSKHMGKGAQSLKNFEPTLKIHEDTSTRRDKNNVNPDVEMINLAKTSITYNALADRISGNLSKVQSVITEGGK